MIWQIKEQYKSALKWKEWSADNQYHMFVGICIWQRERKKERKGEREKERERERELYEGNDI